MFSNIVAEVLDKFVVTMQTSRHLGKELVTKYFSLMSRQLNMCGFSIVMLVCGLLYAVMGRKKRKPASFRNWELSLLTARPSPE